MDLNIAEEVSLLYRREETVVIALQFLFRLTVRFDEPNRPEPIIFEIYTNRFCLDNQSETKMTKFGFGSVLNPRARLHNTDFYFCTSSNVPAKDRSE